MNISNDVPIFKISNSVFQIGNIDYDIKFLDTIIALLTLGNKFVPNYFQNNVQFFHFLLLDIDLKIIDFNKRMFFKSRSNTVSKNNNTTNYSSLTNYKFDDLFFENLFKYLNRKNHIYKTSKDLSSELYINRDSMNLRLEIHKKLQKIFNKIDIKPNITYEQLKIISIFQKNKPFKIIDCDKNVGLALISNDIYEANVRKYLAQDSTYTLINTDILPVITSNINSSLNDLSNNGYISNKILNKLKINDKDNCKLGSFRLLAKLHKPVFGWRPIINCRRHPTGKISNLMDNLLKPLVQRTHIVLKDSQNLIQKCQNITFATKPKIYSMDFSSLYSNMNQIHTANTITDFITPYLDSFHLNPAGFRALLLLILENNYFKYNSLIYLQKIGIAMGCICGPSLANLYLYIIEIKWLYIHRPIFYGRFIDDIAFMDLTDLDLEDFKSIFGNLELNITSGDTVIFLDLIIQFNDSTKQLKFSLYNKPTNNFGYLLTNSNHPEHIFDNIIKSLFIRIRRICTDYSDFVIASIKLAKQLLQRNYKIDKIFNAFRLVSNMDRSLLIPYKNKKDIQTENDILFFTHFNYNLDLKNLIQKSFLNTKKEKSFLSDCNIKIINMINTNINRLFVHNFNIITYKA
jgi:hypothetical protein